MPRHVRDAEVDRFLASKRDGIAGKLALMRELAERPPRLGLGRAGVSWDRAAGYVALRPR